MKIDYWINEVASTYLPADVAAASKLHSLKSLTVSDKMSIPMSTKYTHKHSHM